MELTNFWLPIKDEYPLLSVQRSLILFATSYLYKTGFLVAVIKSKLCKNRRLIPRYKKMCNIWTTGSSLPLIIIYLLSIERTESIHSIPIPIQWWLFNICIDLINILYLGLLIFWFDFWAPWKNSYIPRESRTEKFENHWYTATG